MVGSVVKKLRGICMAKTSNQKQKLILVLDYLRKNTDETHFVSTADLLEYLYQNGITAERKSIYDDINTLIGMGYDIIVKKGNNGGYSLVSREFELAELKLLVDAVQSSKFISERKSNALIKKIETLTSYYEGKKLQRQVYVTNRVKTDNESVFYTIDGIHLAISEKNKISFVYMEWSLEKKLVPRKKGIRYIVEPLYLVWDDENYYLVAKDSASGEIKHYRVDKMNSVEIEEEKFSPEGINTTPVEYSKTHFSMFSGNEEIVTVRFKKELIGVVLDRFGKEVSIIPKDEDYFDARLKVMVSNQFFGWLAGLGKGAKIISPNEVLEQYKALIEEIKNNL